MADHHKCQRNHAFGELAVLGKSCHVPVHRIDAGPYGSQSKRASSKKQVLRRRGTVLHPESGNDDVPRISADEYAKGARFTMLANGLNVGIASSIARSLITTNSQGCSFAAEGAFIAASRSFCVVSSSICSAVYRRTLRRVRIVSNASIFLFLHPSFVRALKWHHACVTSRRCKCYFNRQAHR